VARWLTEIGVQASVFRYPLNVRHQARQRLAASGLAHTAGPADWVRELAGKVPTLTSDQGLRIAARLNIGWSLLWSKRSADALETLLSVAAETLPGRPAVAWDATGLAATVAHQTGLPESRGKVRAALDRLDALGEPPSAEHWPVSRAQEQRIWISACTDPFGKRLGAVAYLHRAAGGSLTDSTKVAGAAWILDETELAVRVLREAFSRLRTPGVRGASSAVDPARGIGATRLRGDRADAARRPGHAGRAHRAAARDRNPSRRAA
jgi:hypothetical protein